MGDYKYYLAKPQATPTLAGCTVRAKSAWQDVTTVNYILLDCSMPVNEKVSIKYEQQTVLPNDKRITIYLRKHVTMLSFKDVNVGNLSTESVRQFRNALYYIKSEWPKITQKYCTIFRGSDVSTELGTNIVDASHPYDSDGWTIWRTSGGFLRPKGVITEFSFDETTNNELILKSLTVELGTN